jgi:hypothetical protein
MNTNYSILKKCYRFIMSTKSIKITTEFGENFKPKIHISHNTNTLTMQIEFSDVELYATPEEMLKKFQDITPLPTLRSWKINKIC